MLRPAAAMPEEGHCPPEVVGTLRLALWSPCTARRRRPAYDVVTLLPRRPLEALSWWRPRGRCDVCAVAPTSATVCWVEAGDALDVGGVRWPTEAQVIVFWTEDVASRSPQATFERSQSWWLVARRSSAVLTDDEDTDFWRRIEGHAQRWSR